MLVRLEKSSYFLCCLNIDTRTVFLLLDYLSFGVACMKCFPFFLPVDVGTHHHFRLACLTAILPITSEAWSLDTHEWLSRFLAIDHFDPFELAISGLLARTIVHVPQVKAILIQHLFPDVRYKLQVALFPSLLIHLEVAGSQGLVIERHRLFRVLRAQVSTFGCRFEC